MIYSKSIKSQKNKRDIASEEWNEWISIAIEFEWITTTKQTANRDDKFHIKASYYAEAINQGLEERGERKRGVKLGGWIDGWIFI